MAKDKGIRAQRVQQLTKPSGSGWYTFTTTVVLDFVEAAQLLLQIARNELRSGADNGLTRFGPSAILLSVTAFETFLNITLHDCMRMLRENQAAFRVLAERDSMTEKVQKIPALVTRVPELKSPDLQLVQHVRNEIAHYYVRPVGTNHVPEWLQPLADKGVLYSIGTAPKDIDWPQKLQSWQLANWCATTVAAAADQFGVAMGDGNATDVSGLIASNARMMAQYFRSLII